MSVVTTTPDPTILGPALSGTVPAPVGRRIGAALIDGGLMLAVQLFAYVIATYVVWWGAFPLWSQLYRLVSTVAGYTVASLLLGGGGITGLLVLAWGLVQWRLHATTGQTIGKRAVGIRTLAVPGGTAPGWGRTFGRYALIAIANLFCFAGLLVVLSVFWDPSRLLRGWHDKAANVFLVDIRSGRDPLALRSGNTLAEPSVQSTVTPSVPMSAPQAAALPAPVTTPPNPPVPPAAPLQPVAEVGLPSPASARPAVPPPAHSVSPTPVSPTPVPPTPVPPAPVSSGTVSSGAGIISAVPGVPTAAGAVPPPPPPPPPAPPVAPLGARPVVPVTAGPFSPMPAPPVDDDDAELTVASLSVTPSVSEVRLVFDTGAVLPVTGRGRIGRDPVAGEEPVTHLVPLPDTTKSVSKTHLEFVLADGGLWVCDLHSTNGSSIERAGARTALAAGEWVRAETGAVVHVGSRTFRVEVP